MTKKAKKTKKSARATSEERTPGHEEERELVGVLRPPGITGGHSTGDGRTWGLSLTLGPWRFVGGPLVQEAVRLTKQVGQTVLRAWMDEFRAHEVIRLTARWEAMTDPWGGTNSRPPFWSLIGKPAVETADVELTRLAARDKRIELEAPPFPRLLWDHAGFWVAEASFPAWAGSTTILVPTRGPRSRPSKAQAAAFLETAANGARLREVVLDAVFERRAELEAHVGAPKTRGLSRPEDLDPLLPLVAVHLHDRSKGGRAYVGFEMECPWDPEHGLGVTLHGTRVVAVGSADVALGEFDD